MFLVPNLFKGQLFLIFSVVLKSRFVNVKCRINLTDEETEKQEGELAPLHTANQYQSQDSKLGL